MKLKRNETRHYFTCNLTNAHLTCAALSINDHQNLSLNALRTYDITHDAAADGTLYNLSALSTFISRFAHSFDLHHATAILAVSGSALYEKIALSPVASARPEQFVDNRLHAMAWQAHYLHPTLENTFAYYIVGMTREQRAQYQMLALHSGINLIALTTPLTAQLHAYKKMHGVDFKYTSAHADIDSYSAALRTSLDDSSITKLATIAPRAAHAASAEIFTACGLALAGEYTHEER